MAGIMKHLHSNTPLAIDRSPSGQKAISVQAPVLFSWSGGQGLGRVAQSQHHYHPDLFAMASKKLGKPGQALQASVEVTTPQIQIVKANPYPHLLSFIIDR
jgi:hypothetical protein